MQQQNEWIYFATDYDHYTGTERLFRGMDNVDVVYIGNMTRREVIQLIWNADAHIVYTPCFSENDVIVTSLILFFRNMIYHR